MAKRWNQLGKSEYPWEQEALEHVKALLPDAEPYRAWATFTFVARSGHVRECDLFVVTPGGLHLIEIKSHPGRVTKEGDTYVFQGSERTLRTADPLSLTNRKTKELKEELQRAAAELGLAIPPLFIKPAVFFSALDLRSQLTEQQAANVFVREDRQGQSKLPGIWSGLLRMPPQNPRHRIDQTLSRTVAKLMEHLGVQGGTSHLRLGTWQLSTEILESGPTWEDRIATRPDMPGEQRRARVYLYEAQADEERRRSTLRAAQREYQVLQGITHRGIAQAVDFQQHDAGPAVLFRHEEGDLRLDRYLERFDKKLGIDLRLDLVRQVAEAVQYAHRRHLYHQALAARSIYVSCREDGSRPVVRIGDWQTAARDSDSMGRSYLLTDLSQSHIESAAQLYLAPEWRPTEYPDPVWLDLFGLGAVSYLILAGKPPAPTRADLLERLAADEGLRLSAVVDGVTATMDDLVFDATRAIAFDRTQTAEDFLAGLDRVEEELTAPTPRVEIDPLQAVKGQEILEDWVIEQTLGSGATAKALLIKRKDPVDGATHRPRVIKVALDQDKAKRLLEEAETLAEVGGGTIVRLLEPPTEIAHRTVLVLEFAGERSLARWLKDEDTPTWDQIDRFSGDLLVALDQLEGKGVWHRDIKPDNLGVHQRDERSYELKLYDFSLSKISERDIGAGTRAYLDPFLGTQRRPSYDGYAERYAAGVTLHQLVTHGRRPIWGDEISAPQTGKDDLPYLAEELFDPALREDLIDFFGRCFHRDHNRRFARIREMRDAWRLIMAKASRPATEGTAGPSGLGADAPRTPGDAATPAVTSSISITVNTPLSAAGLSPRAVSAAGRLSAATVGELLSVPLYLITRVRGAGNNTKQELNKNWRAWRELLGPTAPRPVPLTERGGAELEAQPAPADDVAFGPIGPEQAGAPQRLPTVEDLLDLILGPKPTRPTKGYDALRVMLGLPDSKGRLHSGLAAWPAQADVASRIGTSQPTVSRAWTQALDRWFAVPALAEARTLLADILAASGRVMESSELAAELRVRCGVRPEETDTVTLRRIAQAVVHALVDTERRRGEIQEPDDSDGSQQDEQEPRFLAPAYGERVLIALDSLAGDEDLPTAADLRDHAKQLGAVADELASRDPLAGPDTVLRTLRAVSAPEGMPRLTDTRLVRLAANAAPSGNVAVSQRLELHLRDLPLERALAIAHAGAHVGDGGLAYATVLARVASRFPELAFPRPSAHELHQLLDHVGYRMDYDAEHQLYVAHSTSLSLTTFSQGLHGPRTEPQAEETSETLRRLEEAVQRGGFRALTVDVKADPELGRYLAAGFATATADIGSLFLAELRALVDERGRPTWDKVIAADLELTATGQMPYGFGAYVTEVWTRLAARLRTIAGPRQVLLLRDASLMARYPGGMTMLADLRNAARRAGESPHGLWILCPADDPGKRPKLGDDVVEVEAHEWVQLGGAAVGELAARTLTEAG